MSNVSTNYFDYAACADLLITGNILHDALKIGLFTNNLTLNNQTTLSDLVEANFDGYVRANAGTWSAVYQQQDGSFATDSQLVTFTATDGNVPNVLYGYFVCDSTVSGTPLLWAELFSAPININAQYQGFSMVAQFAYGLGSIGQGYVIV